MYADDYYGGGDCSGGGDYYGVDYYGGEDEFCVYDGPQANCTAPYDDYYNDAE